jgi:hypothetical protein
MVLQDAAELEEVEAPCTAWRARHWIKSFQRLAI